MSLWSDLVERIRHGAAPHERQARIDAARAHEEKMARADAVIGEAEARISRTFTMAQEYDRIERIERRKRKR